MNLDFSSHFANVVDNQLPITLKLRGGVKAFDVEHAHKQGISHKEIKASAGSYTSRDVVWYLQSDDMTQAGAVGAKITYQSQIYKVLEAAYEAVDGVWRCVTRALPTMTTKVCVQHCSYTKEASGAQVPAWVDLYAEVSAHVEEISRSSERFASQGYTERTFDVYLAEDFDLDKTHRIVDAEGTVYKFVTYAGETLSELSTFTAIVDPFPHN